MPSSAVSHSELIFDVVVVPAANLLGGEGDGFTIAQARLRRGRIHHAMRAIGMAERALALMTDRAKHRVAFGRPLAEHGVARDLIAQSRTDIEQTHLLVQKTAWLIDRHGAKGGPHRDRRDQGCRARNGQRRRRPRDRGPRRR